MVDSKVFWLFFGCFVCPISEIGALSIGFLEISFKFPSKNYDQRCCEDGMNDPYGFDPQKVLYSVVLIQ